VIDRHIANGFTSCLIGSLLAVASLPTSADPVTVRSILVASDSTSTLAQLRSSGDLDLQRRHAWKVLNELASTSVGNESTAFESWYGEGAVFSASGDPNTRGIGGFARSSGDNGVVTAHDRFAFQGVPVLSYTLYNDAAYTHIRANQLYKVAQLDRLRISGRQDEEITVDRAIPEFPAQAVVLKTAWWPVAAQRVTALPIWDPAENPNRRAGNDYTTWQRVVAIDSSNRGSKGTVTSIDFAGQVYRRVPRFGVESFFHVEVDAKLAKQLSEDPEARAASTIALGRAIRPGDILILVAANLATKEILNWVWVTFWWHDHANRGSFAAQRPSNLRAEWRHYLMQVAFDSDKPLEPDGQPHVCFNPWLEGRFPDGGHGGGMVSNCLACHQRASYPPINFLPVTRGPPDRAGDPAYAPSRLRTGFLWSIALHAVP
jgi:hypothetical protein